MDFKYIIGIDQSKATFHFCIMAKSFEVLWEGQRDNHTEAIQAFIEQVSDLLKGSAVEQTLLCVEHTGMYSTGLVSQGRPIIPHTG